MFLWNGKTKQKKQDIVGIQYISGKDGNIIAKLKDRMEAWKEHREKPINEENK